MEAKPNPLLPLRLFILVAAQGVMSSLLAMQFDSRIVLGVSVWVQPAKLWLSFGVYAASLMLILPMISSDYPKLVSIVARGTVYLFYLGMVIVYGAVYRGVKPHYNTSTYLDAAGFTAIAVMISVIWIFAVFVIRALFDREIVRENSRDPVRRMRLTCAQLGLIILALTSVSANIMSFPRRWQIEEYKSGEGWEVGSHLFGGRDGEGTMIPILGWSSQYGDLRVSHFIGLHSLQIMLLFGLISRNRGRARILGGACLLLWLSTYLQGLSEQPVTHVGGAFFLFNVVSGLTIVGVFLLEGGERLLRGRWDLSRLRIRTETLDSNSH